MTTVYLPKNDWVSFQNFTGLPAKKKTISKEMVF